MTYIWQVDYTIKVLLNLRTQCSRLKFCHGKHKINILNVCMFNTVQYATVVLRFLKKNIYYLRYFLSTTLGCLGYTAK